MKKIIVSVMFFAALAVTTFGQSLQLKWSSDTVLRIPESVLFDSKANVLYVSNIDGKSGEKDGKGFISKMSPDGKIIALEWATGLNAPKGMGLNKGSLYVADLTGVAVFDVATGKQTNRVEIEGAKFLNDITIDSKGNVYISDSETRKIHKLSGNKAELYFESPEFKRINGLLALKDELYVADAGNGKNYKLSADKKLTPYAETAPGADGIVLVGKDEYIVSSWSGEVYFVDANRKSQKLLDTKEQKLNSADIDYDSKTKTVFVPTFNGNKVMAYEFKK
ncbi:ATP/GTP-binding protein [Fulvivirgaceae bacterium PWU4]|uniref:ATP/GTP-binding protein n=1 Tax=Chryseosolibacter histidini TaxID=2782349 RepID=A0AAP2DN57_9BACT|nr:ATP/GTP-binding protein [Chryseosolibacter histidini]MBT1699436.1 ATP/GTP-binding protein [Chryseosolibacter histidini]